MISRITKKPTFIGNLFLAGLVLLALGIFISTHDVPEVEGQTFANHNVAGWVWSDTIGWISLSCDNPNDGADCASVNYGLDFVDIGGSILDLQGFAWSSNVGWINFDPLGPYPNGNNPNYHAQADKSTGEVSGWARACNAMPSGSNCNAAGDQGDQDYGWILLKGTASDSSPYSVDVDTNTGEFSGYAWGGGSVDSAVIGWIQFDCDDPNNPWPAGYAPEDCPQVANGVFSSPPEVQNLVVSEPDNTAYCNVQVDELGNPLPYFTFSWTYFDTDGDPQQKSIFQISSNPSFPPGNTFEQELLGTGNTVSLPVVDGGSLASGELDYGNNTNNNAYYWRVKVVSTNNGEESGWVEGSSINTPSHPFPKSDFSWNPLTPRIDEQTGFVSVDFNNLSISFYTPNPALSFYWTFPGPPISDISNTTQDSPTVVFSQTGDHNISLQATDASGQTFNGSPYQCTRTKVIVVKESLPQFIEEIPRVE